MSIVDDADRAYARAVRALLQGRAPESPVDALPGPRDAELDERADVGDVDAALLLRARRELSSLPKRVQRALDAEAVDVVLADGSSLPLDKAERLLAGKEERATHRALRASLDAALVPFRHFEIHRSDALSRPAHARTTTSGAEPKTLRNELESFLAETTALRDAALDALGVVGGERPGDPASLSRALDLPDRDGAFGEPALLALLGATREAARPARRVSRIRVPRAMAGVVLDDGDDVRFGHPPAILRYDRFARTLSGGVGALVAARPSGTPASALELVGALKLGLLSAASLRRATDAPRAAAERTARVSVATELLRARAHARIALSGDVDETRDGLVDALGADAGMAVLAELASPRWTCFDDVAIRALAAIDAAAIALALRDAFDETFALEPATWNEATSIASTCDINAGWTRLAGELL